MAPLRSPTIKAPDPLVIGSQGRSLRVRHDDPRIGPYTPGGARLRSAIELASDVEGLRLVLASTVGDRYRVRVSDDGTTVDCGGAPPRPLRASLPQMAGLARCCQTVERGRPALRHGTLRSTSSTTPSI